MPPYSFFFIEIVWKNIHLMHLFIVHPRRPRGSQSGREKRQDENFQVQAKEPLGTDSYRTISKNSSRCLFLIGHKKCFVLLCLIREQFLLSSFREFVHDAIFSGSCTKEMHAVSKLSVWYKISIWFQNIVCPKFTFFQSLSWLFQLAYFAKCCELFWSWNSINHIQVHEENEFCHCLFTSLTKRGIRHFHG